MYGRHAEILRVTEGLGVEWVNSPKLTLSLPEVIICNFSLQYLFIIQQTGNKNIQTLQVELPWSNKLW